MPIGSSYWIEEGMLVGELRNVRGGASQIEGFQFTLRNQFFHGSHPLGWFRHIEVAVDGEPVPTDRIRFVLRDQEIPATLMPDLLDIWWLATETAYVRVIAPGGLEAGEHELGCALTITGLGHTPALDWAGIRPQLTATLHGRFPLEVAPATSVRQLATEVQ